MSPMTFESIPLQQGLRQYLKIDNVAALAFRKDSITTRIKTKLPYGIAEFDASFESIPLQQGLRQKALRLPNLRCTFESIPLQQGLRPV